MYSFAQRADTRVVDEPLYGHYLRVSGADHPGKEDVMRAMDCDGNAVMRRLLQQHEQNPHSELLFIKHMAHHLSEIDLTFMGKTRNVLLIRNPHDMLPSLTVQIPDAALVDTGLAAQWWLFQDLKCRGQSPIVVDSRDLLLNPAGLIASLCQHIGIDFVPCMLSWPAGPIPEDGVWARHWYDAVHRSTGFLPYRARSDFPSRLRPLLDECQPFYDKLYAAAIHCPLSQDLQT